MLTVTICFVYKKGVSHKLWPQVYKTKQEIVDGDRVRLLRKAVDDTITSTLAMETDNYVVEKTYEQGGEIGIDAKTCFTLWRRVCPGSIEHARHDSHRF